MDISNVLGTEITSAGVFVYLTQVLKQSKYFPLLKEGQASVTRAWSMFWSAMIALGISWSWTKDPATGLHTFAIMNIGFWSIVHGGWHWLNQYCFQEMAYQSILNKPGIVSAASAGPSIPARVDAAGNVVVPVKTGV